jgi:hypothetical protein
LFAPNVLAPLGLHHLENPKKVPLENKGLRLSYLRQEVTSFCRETHVKWEDRLLTGPEGTPAR